jgi:hypothetical protein
MASPAPVEVGAQGTIGSLVCREIEYYRTTEGTGAKKKSGSKKAAANGGTPSKARKKGGAFLPSMCSSAEVAVAAAAGSQAPRFRYRHLGEPQD